MGLDYRLIVKVELEYVGDKIDQSDHADPDEIEKVVNELKKILPKTMGITRFNAFKSFVPDQFTINK